MRGYSAGCLFSGMGGFASGMEAAGFRISWGTDHDRWACETFRHRFPRARVVEQDVRDLSVAAADLAPVEVLVAGFPCQSFSQAGDRRGFEDPRGRLFFQIPRLIGEYPASRRPALVVLENVPHLLYGAEGAWFETVRRELRRAGYWFRAEACWKVNVSEVSDSPQDRERLFMVAASRAHFSYNPFRPPAAAGAGPARIDSIVDRTRRAAADLYLPEDNRYYRMIAAAMAKGKSSKNVYQLRRSYVREKLEGRCPTLTANMGIGGHNVPFIRDRWGIRKFSVEEVCRLQGFAPGECVFPDAVPPAERYRLLGNAVCVHLSRLVAEECSRILEEELREEAAA